MRIIVVFSIIAKLKAYLNKMIYDVVHVCKKIYLIFIHQVRKKNRANKMQVRWVFKLK